MILTVKVPMLAAVRSQNSSRVWSGVAARKAVVAEFDKLGLLEEVKPHDLTVPYGDRGGVVIEPDADRPMVCTHRTAGESSH